MRYHNKSETKTDYNIESTWEFDKEWTEIEINWDINEIDWPLIDLNWNFDLEYSISYNK